MKGNIITNFDFATFLPEPKNPTTKAKSTKITINQEQKVHNWKPKKEKSIKSNWRKLGGLTVKKQKFDEKQILKEKKG